MAPMANACNQEGQNARIKFNHLRARKSVFTKLARNKDTRITTLEGWPTPETLADGLLSNCIAFSYTVLCS